ncbi:hypothetical protein [Listeria booriae]|uniref:hypothetical protein n=1 Tax=Listeria booriae TaxID=1552123 RepID=UPI0016293D31|nr:hypothetical protein [Listeria booriae]MBC2303416.1 hypothetical protein [Listeria booriae]
MTNQLNEIYQEIHDLLEQARLLATRTDGISLLAVLSMETGMPFKEGNAIMHGTTEDFIDSFMSLSGVLTAEFAEVIPDYEAGKLVLMSAAEGIERVIGDDFLDDETKKYRN